MTLRVVFLSVFLVAFQVAPAQWNMIPELQYASIECLLVTNDSTIFVGGAYTLLLRSTDSGQTWQNIFGNIYADTTLALGTGGGFIFAGMFGVTTAYRSSDNGTTWILANSGLPSDMHAHGFAATDSQVFVSGNHGVYSSSNWGESWSADTAGLNLQPSYPGDPWSGTLGITRVDSLLYTITPNFKGVYVSRVDSVLWTPLGLDDGIGYAIISIDTNVVAATAYGIFVYDRSSSTWFPRNAGLPEYVYSCRLATVDSFLIAYILGDDTSGVYVSSDVGESWKRAAIDDFIGAGVSSMIATPRDVIVGTDMGGWRKPIAEILTSVEVGISETPGNFRLSQVYPNPFNGIANFGLSIADWSNVTLKVYDMLGRELATIINERKGPGEYTVQWDSGNLPSGVYLARMLAGTHIETRSIVLVR